MQYRQIISILLLALCLNSCQSDLSGGQEDHAYSHDSDRITAGSTQDTSAPADTVRETAETDNTADAGQQVSASQHGTAETEVPENPAKTETETEESETASEPEPPVLPEDLHTNIEDPAALGILMDIYETVSAADGAGIYFTDAEEEYWFGIGEENRYHTASTIKPVYCQYLLAGTDLETEVTLQHVSRTSISGKLNSDDIGSVFTVGELIEYAIRDSDNQAYRLLYETFGIEGYNRYAASIGTGLFLGDEWEWCRSTPEDLSRAMLHIYRYGDENSFLIEHLKNTAYNDQIAAGTTYETAHKYGSNGGSDGYHDTAIVYAPERAYVLTIMTHVDPAQTEDENAIFRSAAGLCDALHGVLFADGT